MNADHLWVFHDEVKWQCRMATLAFSDLLGALDKHNIEFVGVSDRPNTERVFYSIQAFLVATGNISKLFWPPRPGPIPERAEELRKSLGIEEDSILKSRNLRNHLEHFDERLEQSLTWGIGFVDVSMSDEGGFVVPDPRMYLRFFNLSRFAVNFRGDVFELRPIYEAIQQISAKIQVALENRWINPLSHPPA